MKRNGSIGISTYCGSKIGMPCIIPNILASMKSLHVLIVSYSISAKEIWASNATKHCTKDSRETEVVHI